MIRLGRVKRPAEHGGCHELMLLLLRLLVLLGMRLTAGLRRWLLLRRRRLLLALLLLLGGPSSLRLSPDGSPLQLENISHCNHHAVRVGDAALTALAHADEGEVG